MIAIFFKRIILAIPVLFAVASITFFLIKLAPGGPFDADRAVSPQVLKNLNEISKSKKNSFGIRPENLSLTNEGGLKGSVFGVEYLGSRKIVTVKTNFGEIKVKTNISTSVKINENVQVKPSNNNIIIFDGETDRSLKSEFMN